MEIKTCYWQLKWLIGFCHRVLFKFNRNTKVFLKYIPRFALVWVVQFMTTQFKSVKNKEKWNEYSTYSFFSLRITKKKGNLCIDKNVRSNHFSTVIDYSLGIKLIIIKGLTKSETLAFLRIWSQCGTRRRMDYFHILLEYSSVKTVSKIEKKIDNHHVMSMQNISYMLIKTKIIWNVDMKNF